MARFRWAVAAVLVGGALASCSSGVRPASAGSVKSVAGSVKPVAGSVKSVAGSVKPVAASSTSPRLVVARHGGLVTWSGVAVAHVTATPDGLYMSWVTSPPGDPAATQTLARLDTSTGAVQARAQFQGRVDSLALAAGSLWVTSTDRDDQLRLSRFDPQTLTRLSTTPVGTDRAARASIAVAGGGLWVAGAGRLTRFSLPDGRRVTTVALAGSATSDVTTDATGSVLVVSVADSGGKGHLEQRDPATGALLNQTPPTLGLFAPLLEGVLDGQLWVSEPTGMQGALWRYDLSPLRLAGPPCKDGHATTACAVGSNAIGAIIADGRVWENQLDGAAAHNRCLDPDGRALTALPLGENERLFAVGQGLLYVMTTASDGTDAVSQRPIPPACAAAEPSIGSGTPASGPQEISPVSGVSGSPQGDLLR